jgi:hypothetical protein
MVSATEKQVEVQKIKLQSKFWTGFVFGLGFTLGVFVILFFIIGIIIFVLNNIFPGLLF